MSEPIVCKDKNTEMILNGEILTVLSPAHRFAIKREITALQSKIIKRDAIIAFYADKKSWSSPFSFDPNYHPCIIRDDVSTDEDGNQHGGKLARGAK